MEGPRPLASPRISDTVSVGYYVAVLFAPCGRVLMPCEIARLRHDKSLSDRCPSATPR